MTGSETLPESRIDSSNDNQERENLIQNQITIFDVSSKIEEIHTDEIPLNPIFSDEEAVIPQMHIDNSEYDLNRNFYQSVIHFFTFNPIATRLLFAIFNRSIRHPRFLHGGAFPVSGSELNKAWLITTFTDAMHVVHRIWAANLFGLLSHDFYNYFYGDGREYNDSISKILLGISPNQSDFASQLGSDIPFELNYWYGVIGLISISGVSVGAHFLSRKNWRESDVSQLYKNIEHYKKLLINDNTNWLIKKFYYTKLQNINNQLNFATVWNEAVDYGVQPSIENNRLTYYNKIADEFPSSTFLINTSSSIINAYNRNDFSAYQNEAVYMDCLEVKERAIEGLKNVSTRAKIYSTLYWKANYTSWRLGVNQNPIHHLIFWVPTVYFSFSTLRLYELYIKKAVQFVMFLNQKFECEDTGQKWAYVASLANYECGVCPEWNVYVGDIYTNQDCITGLLRQPQLPELLSQSISELTNHPSEYNLPLSQQAWLSWTASAFAGVFNALNQTKVDSYGFIDLSISNYNQIPVQDDRIETLTSFIKNKHVDRLNMGGTGIGSYWSNKLLMSTIYSNLTEVNLSATGLDDTGIISYAQIMDQNPLKILYVTDNLITDDGFGVFCDNLPMALNLEEIYFDGNPISPAGIKYCSSKLPLSNIKVFSISRIAQTTESLSQLAYSISQSNVTSLFMDYGNIGDNGFSELYPLINSSIQNLSLAGNYITEQSSSRVAQWIEQSESLQSFNLDDNEFDDESLSTMAEAIYEAALKSISLANNRFGLSGAARLIQAISGSNLEEVNLSNNDVGPEIGQVFFDSVTSNYSISPLKAIYFNSIGLDDEAAISILNATSYTLINHLELSDNQLTSAIGKIFAAIAPRSKLNSINLSNNPLTDDFIAATKDIWKISQITKINLTGTKISSAGATSIAKNVISKISDSNNLTKINASRDFMRALHNAQPASVLQALLLNNNLINTPGGLAMCRVLPSSNIIFDQFSMSENPTENSTNLATCQLSSGAVINSTAAEFPLWMMVLSFYFVIKLINSFERLACGSVNKFSYFKSPINNSRNACASECSEVWENIKMNQL